MARQNPHPGAIVLAALSLPGVWSSAAHAESAPERGLLALKYLHYEDSQPGFKRITVDSPSIYLLAPIGSQWSFEGAATVDSLSGATPRWRAVVSSASTMDEKRTAGDVKVTRYTEHASFTVGIAHSDETDYISNAGSVAASLSSDDNNTTWNVGLGRSSDRIDPVDGGVDANNATRRRQSTEVIVGVTQAISDTDLAQLNLSYTRGRGDFDDPYKARDRRPDERRQAALLARWNHHVSASGSTLRGSYRYYRDSFGIRSHTLGGEWVAPLGGGVSLTPSVRLCTQSAARFYAPGSFDAAGYPNLPFLQPGQLNSGDQRLSAFGAITLGMKLGYRLDPDWSFDLKLEAYEQRSDWRVGGAGSPGIEPFRARFVQIGVSRAF